MSHNEFVQKGLYFHLNDHSNMECALHSPILKVRKLTANGIIPSKGSLFSAGHDLYCAYDYNIPPGNKTLILTDIAVQLPVGSYGRIAPR